MTKKKNSRLDEPIPLTAVCARCRRRTDRALNRCRLTGSGDHPRYFYLCDEHLKKALAKFEGNANLAANALGLSRSAFYRRLEKYGL